MSPSYYPIGLADDEGNNQYAQCSTNSQWEGSVVVVSAAAGVIVDVGVVGGLADAVVSVGDAEVY